METRSDLICKKLKSNLGGRYKSEQRAFQPKIQDFGLFLKSIMLITLYLLRPKYTC